MSADLLEREQVERLPDSGNIVYLVGLKFGTQQNPGCTWAANTLVPAHVAERYAESRFVALSTGNVYPLVPVKSGGALEQRSLTPLGEYPTPPSPVNASSSISRASRARTSRWCV